MAQTRRRRRRKHRGTQSGRIDRRPARGRPRSRAEARSRASQKKRKPERGVTPPTWGSALRKSLIAGALFFILLSLVFARPPLASAALAVFMLGFYVPMSFFVDRFFYDRRRRQEEKERIARTQGRSGAEQESGE
jgi:hypothetical protein